MDRKKMVLQIAMLCLSVRRVPVMDTQKGCWKNTLVQFYSCEFIGWLDESDADHRTRDSTPLQMRSCVC